MRKIREGPSEPELAREMRAQLAAFLRRSAAGDLALRLPVAPRELASRADGHFHLAPELFLQGAGWTDFRFPDATLRLDAGEALVLPPRLPHAERVGGGEGDTAFRNIVVYADGPTLSCHLAHEVAPGRPGIRHLEARQHAQAARIHDWLADAARLGPAAREGTDASAPDAAWAAAQAHALLCAATAGVLRALDDADALERPEPALVARVRVMVENQLGDQELSVRGLAEQSGCTADYLSHVFSQATGEHLVGFVNRQRMERAVRLLRDTGLAVKEIAWACGFAAPSYFIRTFRAHHGMTPKAWRAAHAGPA